MSKHDIFVGMSEAAIRQRVVNEAVKWLGTREGTIEHKKIVDTYNRGLPKLPRGYQLQYDDAWCAAFVSFIGISLGISDVILPEVGCAPMIELYRKVGRWEERDDYVPQLADIIMYDWDAKKGECVGSPDHVGFVVSIQDKSIRVIEGNFENKVQYRDIPIEYIKTRGFCCPDYASLERIFSDVDPAAWYADEVAKSAELGLMVGIGGGEFDPDRPVTRGELAAVAVRLYNKLK